MDAERGSSRREPPWLQRKLYRQDDEGRWVISWTGGVLLLLFSIILFSMTMNLKQHVWPAVMKNKAFFQYDSLDSFSLEERLDPLPSFRSSIRGEVIVAAADVSQTGDLVVEVEFSSSNLKMLNSLDTKKTPVSLSIGTTYPKTDLSGSVLIVTMHVKHGIDLSLLKIDLSHLSLDVRDGLSMQVTEHTLLKTTSGNIALAGGGSFISSALTEVSSSSGTVQGRCTLISGERLSLNTASGSIRVKLVPKQDTPQQMSFYDAPNNDAPPPYSTVYSKDTSFAVQPPTTLYSKDTSLSVQSTSGNVDIDYRSLRETLGSHLDTDVRTVSGRIQGFYSLGNGRLFLKSSSGSINAEIEPMNSTTKANIVTESTSGSLNIDLLPSRSESDLPMRDISGSHKTMSGSMTLKYPQTWEGRISGRAVSGSITLKGKDVRAESVTGESVRAVKGNGHGALEWQSVSGSSNVQVGDL